MSGLSEADVASLNEAHASWILWRERGTWESYIAPAVEAIVARAVSEALTAASDAVLAHFDNATQNEPHDPFCLDGDLSTTEIERNGWLSGLRDAARMVRRRAT